MTQFLRYTHNKNFCLNSFDNTRQSLLLLVAQLTGRKSSRARKSPWVCDLTHRRLPCTFNYSKSGQNHHRHRHPWLICVWRCYTLHLLLKLGVGNNAIATVATICIQILFSLIYIYKKSQIADCLLLTIFSHVCFFFGAKFK